MASSLIPGKVFTMDLLGKHEEGKVPMLDIKVWKEANNTGVGTVVRHGFYDKPTISPLVFHGRGATSIRHKIIILAEEVKRGLLN